MADTVAPADQLAAIKQILNQAFVNGVLGQPAQANQLFFALNAIWWEDWQVYVGLRKTAGGVPAKPGKINNGPLLRADGTLQTLPDSALVFVPHDAWQLFVKWYGGEPAIPRHSRLVEWTHGTQNKSLLFIESKPWYLRLIRAREPSKFFILSYSCRVTLGQLKAEISKKLGLTNWSKLRLVNYNAETLDRAPEDEALPLCASSIQNDGTVVLEEKDELTGQWNHLPEILPEHCTTTLVISSVDLLATASADETLKLWSYSNKRCLRTLRGHKGNVTAIDLHPDLDLLISGSSDRSVKAWKLSKGECTRTIEVTEKVVAVAYIANHQTVAVACESDVFIYDITSGKLIQQLKESVDVVSLRSIRSDPTRLLVGTTANLNWYSETSPGQKSFNPTPTTVVSRRLNCTNISATGKSLYIAFEYRVKVTDAAGNNEKLMPETTKLVAIATNPQRGSKETFVGLDWTGDMRVWRATDAGAFHLLSHMPHPPDYLKPSQIAVSADPDIIAVSYGRQLQLRDFEGYGAWSSGPADEHKADITAITFGCSPTPFEILSNSMVFDPSALAASEPMLLKGDIDKDVAVLPAKTAQPGTGAVQATGASPAAAKLSAGLTLKAQCFDLVHKLDEIQKRLAAPTIRALPQSGLDALVQQRDELRAGALASITTFLSGLGPNDNKVGLDAHWTQLQADTKLGLLIPEAKAEIDKINARIKVLSREEAKLKGELIHFAEYPPQTAEEKADHAALLQKASSFPTEKQTLILARKEKATQLTSAHKGFPELALLFPSGTTEEEPVAAAAPVPEKLDRFGQQINDANVNMRVLIYLTKGVTELDLEKNALTGEGARELFQHISKNVPTIKKLKLARNKINSRGAQSLGALISSPDSQLSTIDLYQNELDDSSMVLLAGALTLSKSITFISVASNKIGDAGIQALVRALKSTPDCPLQFLKLGGNHFTTQAAAELLTVFKASKNLVEIEVGGFDQNANITQDIARQFMDTSHPRFSLWKKAKLAEEQAAAVAAAAKAKK